MGSLVSVAQLPADFERWDEVLALIMRAFAAMDGVIDPPSSAHRLTVENLRDKARQETGFAALNDGRIVGCVFVLERANDFYVGKLAVEPDFQGQGIARRLMQAVEDLARDRGKPCDRASDADRIDRESRGLCPPWLSRNETDGAQWL